MTEEQKNSVDWKLILAIADKAGVVGKPVTDYVQAVLTDVEMPEMDGYEACRALRQRPGAEQMPILMLTVHDDVESIQRAYEAGATDFMAKPVSWPLLGHRLRYMLRATEAFHELARSEAELLRHVAERTVKLQETNARLESANTDLEAFILSVTHELRAPLRAVREIGRAHV